MTETEKMIQEMNSLFAAGGETELAMPSQGENLSELELLERVRKEYVKRLRRKIPKYRMLPSKLIPDMFLQALANREKELKR